MPAGPTAKSECPDVLCPASRLEGADLLLLAKSLFKFFRDPFPLVAGDVFREPSVFFRRERVSHFCTKADLPSVGLYRMFGYANLVTNLLPRKPGRTEFPNLLGVFRSPNVMIARLKLERCNLSVDSVIREVHAEMLAKFVVQFLSLAPLNVFFKPCDHFRSVANVTHSALPSSCRPISGNQTLDCAVSQLSVSGELFGPQNDIRVVDHLLC